MHLRRQLDPDHPYRWSSISHPDAQQRWLAPSNFPNRGRIGTNINATAQTSGALHTNSTHQRINIFNDRRDERLRSRMSDALTKLTDLILLYVSQLLLLHVTRQIMLAQMFSVVNISYIYLNTQKVLKKNKLGITL